MSQAWAWPSVPFSAESREERRPKLRSAEVHLRVPESAGLQQGRRLVEICNACRYCEGYCAVFPAIELRRQFTSGDLSYLANLCHDCRACYYSCQYAPPHEFALNLPKAFSDLRLETYERYAWPRPLAALFRRNGIAASVLALLCTVLFAWMAKTPSRSAAGSENAGAFYAVVSEGVMIAISGAAFLFALLALAMGLRNFWRDTNSPSALDAPSLLAAFKDVFTLRNLGGGGDGCNNHDESFSQTRRYFHHSLFYGFLLCFASTYTAAVYEHIFGWISPYPFLSLPVLLGTVGGAAMLVGIAGLLQIKVTADPGPASKLLLDIDYSFLVLLFVAAATGLLLLAMRSTAAMGGLLAVHLGVIVSLFLIFTSPAPSSRRATISPR
ncbi:MAG: tricarballylate utilization 4Fe-4S protein TcuB [Acidobacteria bacterium]|nr:MAG: tricarballylate utilization 4Fe-4S protein TcuB [Acidobacteriota bacterium]